MCFAVLGLLHTSVGVCENEIVCAFSTISGIVLAEGIAIVNFLVA